MRFRLSQFLFWTLVVGVLTGFLTPYVRAFLQTNRQYQFRNSGKRVYNREPIEATVEPDTQWGIYQSSETPLD